MLTVYLKTGYIVCAAAEDIITSSRKKIKDLESQRMNEGKIMAFKFINSKLTNKG
jgi:hypothetical protein